MAKKNAPAAGQFSKRSNKATATAMAKAETNGVSDKEVRIFADSLAAAQAKAESSRPADLRAHNINYDVQWIPHGDLKPVEFNPADRYTSLKVFGEDIRSGGLLHPLLVIQKQDGLWICAGNRRWAACGPEYANVIAMPCRIMTGNMMDLFRRDVEFTKSLTGIVAIRMYVIGAERALPERMRLPLDECKKYLGINYMKRMARERHTIGTWKAVKKVAAYLNKYLPVETEAEAKKSYRIVADWLTLTDSRFSHKVNRLIGENNQERMTPAQIWSALKSNKIIDRPYR
jgi:hypothetical protein